MVVYLPEPESAHILSLIEAKMKEVNQSLGDTKSDVSAEAKKVLKRVLHTSTTREDLQDRLIKVLGNLESVMPMSKAAWFQANANLLRCKATAENLLPADVKKSVNALLKVNEAGLQARAAEIGAIQAAAKSCKGRESGALDECVAALDHVLALPHNSFEQIQLLCALCEGGMMKLAIDGHMRDTIVQQAAGAKAASSSNNNGTNGVDVHCLLKLIGVVLGAQLALRQQQQQQQQEEEKQQQQQHFVWHQQLEPPPALVARSMLTQVRATGGSTGLASSVL
jgi:hypothetical protein